MYKRQEFNSSNGIDLGKFISIISGFSEKSKAIFVFYNSTEFYYAINSISSELHDKIKSYCLFILEDRQYEYKANSRHLSDVLTAPQIFEFGALSYDDATAICSKINSHAIKLGDFSELSLERQAGKLMSRELGFNGDLLSALYSLTTHENFETKIHKMCIRDRLCRPQPGRRPLPARHGDERGGPRQDPQRPEGRPGHRCV